MLQMVAVFRKPCGLDGQGQGGLDRVRSQRAILGGFIQFPPAKIGIVASICFEFASGWGSVALGPGAHKDPGIRGVGRNQKVPGVLRTRSPGSGVREPLLWVTFRVEQQRGIQSGEVALARGLLSSLERVGAATVHQGRHHQDQGGRDEQFDQGETSTTCPGRLGLQGCQIEFHGSGFSDFIGDHTQNFLNGGVAVEEPIQPLLVEGFHVGIHGNLHQFPAGSLGKDGFTQGIIGDQQLGEGCPVPKSGPIAFVATLSLSELGIIQDFSGQVLDQMGIRFIGCRAILAIDPNQAQSHDAHNAGAEQKRLNAHVEETREDASRRAAVDGADHQVACQTGLNRDGGGVSVPNLSDHDHLWVLAEQGSKSDGVGKTPVCIQLRLGNHGEGGFHGILDRTDADPTAVLLEEIAQGGIDHGGLARACGTVEQDQSAGAHEE